MVNIWIRHFPLEKFFSSLTLWIQHWNTNFLVSAAIHTLQATRESGIISFYQVTDIKSNQFF
jgi:hypothetical protein